MGKIISMANHKGGVGKTTTALSLGAALTREGKKVLLVDLDAQHNLTDVLTERGKEYGRTVFEALTERDGLPVEKLPGGLDLVPASVDLVGIEKALTVLVHDGRKELFILRKLLEPMKGEYDFILIDCPPSLGILTKNALAASDEVIITLTPESLPSLGMQSLLDGIDQVQKSLNKDLRLLGILITRFARRKINRLVEEGLRESFGGLVFRTKIRDNVDLTEAPLYRMNIFDYSPESNGAKDYEDLAREILKTEQI